MERYIYTHCFKWQQIESGNGKNLLLNSPWGFVQSSFLQNGHPDVKLRILW